MSRRVELLAPAGSPEGFYGAIHAGADAVYLAGNRFGARAYADNFTTDELIACIRYAHILGRKVYLTVNTLIKEAEFDELAPYLTPFHEAGLDGVIVQDIGVFCFIREHFPGLELHVSTQMTLTGKYGADLLKKMGAVRIVPARELSLTELTEIKKETNLEIETFIHGAMCYCYSGQCLFSSILGGRSGNRGRCAQPCRLPYRVDKAGKAGKECYPLSLKDMCTIEHIPELIAAGIDSFKIEGRMKKSEYAAGVTAIYRKYIDKYYAGENCIVSSKDLDALGKLYIRSERESGYYYRHNGRDMITLDNPSYSGTDDALLEAVRFRYLDKQPELKVCMNAFFMVGEPAKLTLTLVENTQIQVEVIGDEVSPAMKQPITEENIQKQLSKLGETLFSAEEIHVALDDNAFYPLKAINDLRRRAVVLMENCLIQENGLCVERTLSEEHSTCLYSTTMYNRNVAGSCVDKECFLHVLVRTREQMEALVNCLKDSKSVSTTTSIKRVYLEADFVYEAFSKSADHIFDQCRILRDMGCELIIALPPVLRLRDEKFLTTVWQAFKLCKAENFETDSQAPLFQGFLVRSMDGLGFLEKMRYGSGMSDAIYADAGFYMWNRFSLQAFSDISALNHDISARLKGFCLPFELRASEQKRLLQSNLSTEKIIYGRIPLMHTANCIKNTVEGCDKTDPNKICHLTDRYKKHFPVLRNCTHCINTIYNSLPLSLHGEFSKWRGEVDFRLDFTIEDGQETAQILQYFMSGIKKGTPMGEPPFGEYTTGHEKRGAE